MIIMAGGFGTRLKPLINVLPKSLFPVGAMAIVRQILERFNHSGCSRFYLSVNYKAELNEYNIKIRTCHSKLIISKRKIDVHSSPFFLQLKNCINETFSVSNCDLINKQEYSEPLDYQMSNKNEITIIVALKHYRNSL